MFFLYSDNNFDIFTDTLEISDCPQRTVYIFITKWCKTTV